MPKEPQILEGPELEAALQFICDYYTSRPKLEPASRAAGFGSKWIYRALNRSGAGDPRYLIRWPDRDAEEKIQFIEAVALAHRMWKMKFGTSLMQESEEGVPRLQIHGGQVLWEKDPELLARYGGETDEARDWAKMDGVQDFPFKLRVNTNGNLERIPLVIYEHVPATLRVHVARSILPGMNPPEHRSSVTSHTGSVFVVARKPYHDDYVPSDAPVRTDLQQRLSDLRKSGPKRLPQVPAPANEAPQAVAAQPARRPPDNIGRGTVPPNGMKVC